MLYSSFATQQPCGTKLRCPALFELNISQKIGIHGIAHQPDNWKPRNRFAAPIPAGQLNFVVKATLSVAALTIPRSTKMIKWPLLVSCCTKTQVKGSHLTNPHMPFGYCHIAVLPLLVTISSHRAPFSLLPNPTQCTFHCLVPPFILVLATTTYPKPMTHPY